MLKDFLLLAGRSIAHRKLRSWLTVIGVFIGITAVVALISFGLGVEKTINDRVSTVFGVDTFMLVREGAFGGRQHAGGDVGEYSLDLDYLRSIDGVRVAAAVRQRTGFVRGEAGPDGKVVQGFLPVMGLSPELATEFKSFLPTLALEPGGRLFTQDDQLAAILGSEVAGRLHANVGDTIVIAGDADLPELSLTVVGVLEPTESAAGEQGGFAMSMEPSPDTIYVPYDTMNLLWRSAEDVEITLARVDPGRDVQEVADRVEGALKARGSKVTAVTYQDISDMIGTMTTAVSAFLAGIAGISLLVGAVGVMNTMFTSVLERTKEIGVMKAVGAKNRHILSIFLIESGLMGLVGGVVGTLLGLGFSALGSMLVSRLFDIPLSVVISWVLIVITLAGSFVLGATAGVWPAWRASRLPVVDALRYE